MKQPGWLTIFGEVAYLTVCVLSVVGAFAACYWLVAGWRQAWAIW